METNDWQGIIKIIRTLFLDYDEENSTKIAKDIDRIISNLPAKGSDLPYIGKLNDEYNFLKQFQFIPDDPQAKDFILDSVSNIFSGALKWHHPHVMHNVIPAPMIATVAAATVSSLYNLNPIWDFISAGAHKMEHQIVRQFSDEIEWDQKSAGVFTSGGKGCIIYALRIGLNRCINSISSQGLSAQRISPIVITSQENHYCIDTAASLLGIGYLNVWRAEVNDDETMNITSFERLLTKAYEENIPIAAVVVCGGSTSHLTMDNLAAVSLLIDDMTIKYKVKYKPYIYFDTCVAWPWIFYINYDFKNNPLKIPMHVLSIIKKAADNISSIKIADGFGIDFHKTGFCSYNNSLFITKNGDELNSIFKDELTPFEEKIRGGNFTHSFTLEHSRSANPIVSAWVALQVLGRNGIRSYLCNQIAIACQIRKILPKYNMELLNSFSLAFASVFFPVPCGQHISYWELMDCDSNIIKYYNEYTFRLFNYFQDKDKNGIDSFIFRFVPQYRKAKCGSNIAVLVIFPMATTLTIESIDIIAEKIGKIKLRFDSEEDTTDITGIIPAHVIK